MKINISKKKLKKKINVGWTNSEKKKFYRPKLSKHDFFLFIIFLLLMRTILVLIKEFL